MAITFITPHQRANSGGVYAIEQWARHAAMLTDVNLVVAKGRPKAIKGVKVLGPSTLPKLALPPADALLIPADMRDAEPLFGLAPEHGAPIVLLQGFGWPDDPVVHANLILARHAICTSSWLLDAALEASCTATLVRYGLDRAVFSAGPPTTERGPIVAMMTHPLDWKGTADGLRALELAREDDPELRVRLFGKADPQVEWADYLPTPNTLEQVAEIMREAAVFVCSSWEEGFGMPGIEAIASGAALATTDTKGSRDYAFHGRTALVTPPGRPEALAESIISLIRDDDLRGQLIRAGQHHINAVYPDWERATGTFVSAVAHEAARLATRTATRREADLTLTEQGLHEAQTARLHREIRRMKLLLRDKETERVDVEAELSHRRAELTESRRTARALALDLESAREASQLAETARASSDARASRLAGQLAEAEQHLNSMDSARRAAESEVTDLREELAMRERVLDERTRRLEEAAVARRETEARLTDTTDAMHAERSDLTSRLELAERGHTMAQRELVETRQELELSQIQHERMQAALSRARADAQLAEAQHGALERRVSELVAQLSEVEEAVQRRPRKGRNAAPGQRRAHRAVATLPELGSGWPELPESERTEQSAFRSIYDELITLVPDSGDRRDALALPLMLDTKGMIVGSSEEQGDGPSVDVIVCVHNALEDVRLCLWALAHKATRPMRLIVVNDGSDEATTAFLEQAAARIPALTLIHRTQPPHGYTLAANTGVRASTSDYVVLLNSDTVVTFGWLERIVDYGERHKSLGILGPMSNSATHQSVPERRAEGQWAANPLPDWLTPDGMALILERGAPRTATRLPFLNGFCYVVRREVINAIGLFDEENFAAGYAEENDYSQRARDAGFELGVVDDAYVFHRKSASYGAEARTEIARRHYETFLDKHGREKIQALVRELESGAGLNPVRVAVAEALVSPAATASAVAGLIDVPMSIAFVLPGLGDGGSGGSHSIYQEVRGLRRLGVRARIMLRAQAMGRARGAYDDADEVFEPFDGTDDLADRTRDANVIIATHFKSVAAVAELRRGRDDFLPAYYVQDYEPMFNLADPADREEAFASYTAIPDALLFAKTHWLCNVVSIRHHVFVAKVEPSIDSDLYFSDDPAPGMGPLRVSAMVRPRTPRRQPYSTIGVLERLVEQLGGDIEVTTFGCREPDLERLTRTPEIRQRHRGLLKREQVADLLRQSHVFLDMSTYQAFGRTALEAMACGATAAVPHPGGVWEFAQDGTNVVTLDTLDRESALHAVLSLAEDRRRLAELRLAAAQTGRRYSILRAALSEYLVLRTAYLSRFGSTLAAKR